MCTYYSSLLTRFNHLNDSLPFYAQLTTPAPLVCSYSLFYHLMCCHTPNSSSFQLMSFLLQIFFFNSPTFWSMMHGWILKIACTILQMTLDYCKWALSSFGGHWSLFLTEAPSYLSLEIYWWKMKTAFSLQIKCYPLTELPVPGIPPHMLSCEPYLFLVWLMMYISKC